MSTSSPGSLVIEHRTLPMAFQASVARVPERPALRTPGGAVELTWADYGAEVLRVAGALAAVGVRRGDRVALLSRIRPELAVAEVAALHLGAAAVALYPASPPATIEHALRDSEPTVLLVESALQGRLADVHHSVANVFCLDASGGVNPALESLAAPSDFDFHASWSAVQPHDLAALIYTSGTTGPAKGVEWTHLAATGGIDSFDRSLGEADGIQDVSYAPFASLAERYGGHWHALVRGSTRTLCDDPTQLGVALLDVRPTRLGGPPQVWQRLKQVLESTLDAHERAVLDGAIERFRAHVREDPYEPAGDAEEATLATLRARLGLDRINRAVSTAAPCPLGVHEHYNGLGVPFREMFAMTEAGVVTAQLPGPLELGTLGAPTPGFELRIARDGEVLVRSPNAPRGYRNRPRESARAYAADGWIHTGDTGELDVGGRLRLIGRKKEMIVPTHGHNVAPAPIESALKDTCVQIAHVCVLGDGRSHLTAIVAIDPGERTDDERTRAAVLTAIEQVNAGLDARERIEAHTIVADAWLPGAELTETLKMRRTRIEERYADAIEQLYSR